MARSGAVVVRTRRVGVDERRARLARRHHLAAGAQPDGVVGVARDLVALHSTDAASVYLSLWARLPGAAVGGIERALYEDRTLVRMLGMRRTVFVLPVELAPVVHAACTQAIAVLERRKLVQLLEEAGIAPDDPGQWLAGVEAATLRALATRGDALAAELGADVPELRRQILVAQGKKYEGLIGVSTRVLFLLAADGRVVRGRPRGSWISSQYRWATTERWLPGGLPDWSVELARAELARRWLSRYGPATAADLKWWTGWTLGAAQKALAEVGAAEVELAEGTGYLLADDAEPVPAAAPAAVLLPALDPTPMGWTKRDWFLGDHGPALFDRSGNIGPTIWWDARIVGGWAQRKDGAVVTRLIEDPGAEATAAITAQAERLTAWLGPMRITARFRTPLERELTT